MVERCFTGTPSRVQGVDFQVLAEETLRRHLLGYPQRPSSPAPQSLENPGQFHWRAEGERHAWDPQAIADLQVAARANSSDAYSTFRGPHQ